MDDDAFICADSMCRCVLFVGWWRVREGQRRREVHRGWGMKRREPTHIPDGRFASSPTFPPLRCALWCGFSPARFLVGVFSHYFGDRGSSVVVVVLTDAYFVACSSHRRRCYTILTHRTAAWRWWGFLFYFLSFVLPFVWLDLPVCTSPLLLFVPCFFSPVSRRSEK